MGGGVRGHNMGEYGNEITNHSYKLNTNTTADFWSCSTLFCFELRDAIPMSFFKYFTILILEMYTTDKTSGKFVQKLLEILCNHKICHCRFYCWTIDKLFIFVDVGGELGERGQVTKLVIFCACHKCMNP